MKGISYLVDEGGRKTAVILDLQKHGRLWEDIHDRLLIAIRRDEPRESLEQVRQRLGRSSNRSKASTRSKSRASRKGNG